MTRRRQQQLREARYNFLKGLAMGLCVIAAFTLGLAFQIVLF